MGAVPRAEKDEKEEADFAGSSPFLLEEITAEQMRLPGSKVQLDYTLGLPA